MMMFEDKILLITGGTGSFGNAVLRKLIEFPFHEIRIMSRDEKKQDDMRQILKNPRVKFYIGDVRDKGGIMDAIQGAHYIFHAAALKQVPSCEFFPIEAVKTNVLGADNVMRAAIDAEVEKVVILSTDKAVYPINAMGLSKALMEKTMIANSRHSKKTILCGTRYGNVMASRGSVIPLFIAQIKAGQPITITDPKMTRFMMTLEDAVDLVMYAFHHGKSGMIYVQKSPAATIEVLAQALIELYNAKSEIRIIGTRHGEKLYETLVNREEFLKAQDLGKYYSIIPDDRDLNYDVYFTEGDEKMTTLEEYTSHNTHRLDMSEMKKLLLKTEIVRTDLDMAGND